MIKLQNINKTFKVYKRDPGFKNAAKALFKHEYETINALQNINLDIKEGEIVGYIGPNGAGKSTTIKIMCGILTPDSGTCLINGYVPWKERKKYVKEIGVVFGQRSQLWWDVPVIDSFELLRDIYSIEEKTYRQSLNEMIELLDIKEILRTPARNLSLGQRMRCEIAASLLHRPKILFLDEPTIGLDAVSKIAVREFFKKINKTYNTTIILTTHDMQDIEALTKRIILIGKGQILLDENIEAIRQTFSDKKTIQIEYDGSEIALPANCKILEQNPGHIIFDFDTNILPIANVIEHVGNQAKIKDIAVSGISSEEMVARLYKEYKV